MFRLLAVLAFGFLLTISFGTSLPANKDYLLDDLTKLQNSNSRTSSGLLTHILDLYKKIQGLTNRLNGARVHCQDRLTPWEPRSDARIMYLDRHNVDCPLPYFLARFQLGRQANRNSAPVRYYYRCCRIIL